MNCYIEKGKRNYEFHAYFYKKESGEMIKKLTTETAEKLEKEIKEFCNSDNITIIN